jgi:hypothetical protein
MIKMLGLRPNRRRQPTHESFVHRTGHFEPKPVLLDDKPPSKAVGGEALDWLLGYETTRFKAFLKAHGADTITSLTVGRVPILKAVRLGFDILTGGEFEKASKKLGVDNFFHLFLVINGKHVVEKNETVNVKPYSKASNEEDMTVPLKGSLTIDELIKKAGGGKDFWLEYNPITNNCQKWVTRVLSANGLLTSDLRSFINQDTEALLKEMPNYNPTLVKDVVDTGSLVNRILQLTTGGRLGFATGIGDVGDAPDDERVGQGREVRPRPKRHRLHKAFTHM